MLTAFLDKKPRPVEITWKIKAVTYTLLLRSPSKPKKENTCLLDNLQVVRGIEEEQHIAHFDLIPAKQGMDSLCYYELYSGFIHTLQR